MGFVLYLLAVLLVAVSFVSDLSQDGATLLLLFGLFPIINALADFGSTGATRYFLRKGLQGQAWKWALIDFGVGFSCFVAIAMAMILAVQAILWLGGPAVIDLPLLFAGAEVEGSIRNAPGQYWWLYLTFLTTLLPTFLHFILWLFSLLVTGPVFVRENIARLLEAGAQGEVGKGRDGLSRLSMAIGLSATLACGLLYWGWQLAIAIGPGLGEGLLRGFAIWARAVGAIA